ncbi:hypothetical protein C8J57DRAFT_1343015 [Mycena rebaudengoi]|nr:hypothetical protein C8J57DRAFT_1405478 [Mycena rebaudengoi]KAJ7257305.1 hypothetical protein C8J57DRAFT_1343015 [Mycena rebaudengoi]
MVPVALSPAFYYYAGGYMLHWRSFHVNSFHLYICVYFVSIMHSLAVLISWRPGLPLAPRPLYACRTPTPATTTRPSFTDTTTLPFNAKMAIANLLIFGFATHKAALHNSSPLRVRWPGVARFL